MQDVPWDWASMCISQSCPSPNMDKMYFATKHVKAQTLIPCFGRFLGAMIGTISSCKCQSRVRQNESHFTLGHKLRLIQHFLVYVTMLPSTFSFTLEVHSGFNLLLLSSINHPNLFSLPWFGLALSISLSTWMHVAIASNHSLDIVLEMNEHLNTNWLICQ